LAIQHAKNLKQQNGVTSFASFDADSDDFNPESLAFGADHPGEQFSFAQGGIGLGFSSRKDAEADCGKRKLAFR
jgi:hypothetical protein